MKTVCNENMCAGCYACVNVCHKEAISIKDSVSFFNAVIDEAKCVGCNQCTAVCPQNERINLTEPELCLQGWAQPGVRERGSSGGVASAIIYHFLLSGGYVCSCLFENGEFVYKIVSDVNDAFAFAGSKYVKSNPGKVYNQIKDILNRKEKVLFIGLPCHVAALRKMIKDQSLLYTIDLICHGTPSPNLLKKYLREKGIDLGEVKTIRFRNKDLFSLCINGSDVTPNRVVDSYMNTFLTGFNYTENCYSCQYATLGRGADITLGDYWGSSPEEMKMGVSLVLCQSNKGKELLDMTKLTLSEANLNVALEHNHQLVHPTQKPAGRDVFMRAILKGKTFNTAYFQVNPIDAIKQSFKYFLCKIGLL